MQGFGFMTFTINLHDTLTANTWRFTPRHQPYELCNPSTCYLITLEISTASSELQERCFISSFHYPSPIISTAFLTATLSRSFQRIMTSIFHPLGEKKNPAHFNVASSRPDIAEFSLETQCEAAPFVYLFCDKNSNWLTWCPMHVCVSPHRLLAPEATNICCQSGIWWKCVFISYRCCNYHNLTPIYSILTIMDNVSVCSPKVTSDWCADIDIDAFRNTDLFFFSLIFFCGNCPHRKTGFQKYILKFLSHGIIRHLQTETLKTPYCLSALFTLICRSFTVLVFTFISKLTG